MVTVNLVELKRIFDLWLQPLGSLLIPVINGVSCFYEWSQVVFSFIPTSFIIIILVYHTLRQPRVLYELRLLALRLFNSLKAILDSLPLLLRAFRLWLRVKFLEAYGYNIHGIDCRLKAITGETEGYPFASQRDLELVFGVWGWRLKLLKQSHCDKAQALKVADRLNGHQRLQKVEPQSLLLQLPSLDWLQPWEQRYRVE